MEVCPSCGKVPYQGGHLCEPAYTYTCDGCGSNIPPNATHECAHTKALRSAMYGKEKTVDKDTENEMRVTALQQAVILTGQGNRDTVMVAESFFKFLMGESQ